MKALTICQPFAHLIMLPDDDDRAKRVENRTWPTSFRGELLIHAGKSKEWLSEGNYGIQVAEMTFGAIVGICRVVDCFNIVTELDSACRRRPWLAGHEHAVGPFCFVLTECRKFDEPILYRGQQGLFDVPGEIIQDQLRKVGHAAIRPR